jgi:hypothetical protein
MPLKIKGVAIVGAGGNGSWLTHHLHELIELDQLPPMHVTIFDADEVEIKNLRYQNFGTADVLCNKAECLAGRYDFEFEPKFVTKPAQLDGFDLIVSAVDGGKFRKMFYKLADKSKFYWIDLRAEGKLVEIYTKHKKHTLESLLATVPEGDENSSCQRAYDLAAGQIQLGNRLAALVGAQFILNWARGESNPPVFRQFI